MAFSSMNFRAFMAQKGGHLIDISAQRHSCFKMGFGNIEDHHMFAVPFTLFEEMEKNIPGSFLERHTWQGLLKTEECRRA